MGETVIVGVVVTVDVTVTVSTSVNVPVLVVINEKASVGIKLVKTVVNDVTTIVPMEDVVMTSAV